MFFLLLSRDALATTYVDENTIFHIFNINYDHNNNQEF